MNRYSTLSNRLGAWIIDGLIFSPIIFAGAFAETWGFGSNDWVFNALVPFANILMISYYVLLHWKYGQTVGKKVAKVKVVDITEKPITFSQAFMRDIAYVIHFLIIMAASYSMILSGYSSDSERYYGIIQYLTIPVWLWFIVDVVVCLKSPKHRALHDYIAGTVVVRLDMYTEPTNDKKLDPPGPEEYTNLVSKNFDYQPAAN